MLKSTISTIPFPLLHPASPPAVTAFIQNSIVKFPDPTLIAESVSSIFTLSSFPPAKMQKITIVLRLYFRPKPHFLCKK
jgi:hypothetical protein